MDEDVVEDKRYLASCGSQCNPKRGAAQAELPYFASPLRQRTERSMIPNRSPDLSLSHACLKP
jgi:hypothetical protein